MILSLALLLGGAPALPTPPARLESARLPASSSARQTDGQTDPRAEDELPVTALIVGDQIVSYTSLEQVLRREMAVGNIKAGSKDDLERNFRRIGNETLVRYIKVQAGKDFGFAPEVIDSIVKRQLEREVELRGGAVDASSDFAQFGLRAGEYQEFTRERVLSAQWERAVIGLGPSGQGRPTVDRYARPGQLYADYRGRLESKDPARRAEIGVYDERVKMQELILDVETHGGEEPTMQLAEALVSALEGGADFGELVQLHGEVRNRDGVLAPQPIQTLEAYSNHLFHNSVLGDFARDAKVGEIMKPSLGQAPGKRQGVFLYKMLERLEPSPAKPFTDRELQLELLKRAQTALDDVHLQDALRQQEESIFVWPRDTWSTSAGASKTEAFENELYQEIGG